MKKTVKARIKPDLDKCPKAFCVSWMSAGELADLSGGVYKSLNDAIKNEAGWVRFEEAGCGSTFGPCKRNSAETGDKDTAEYKDYYEPNEPHHEKSGLNILFFCHPETLTDEAKLEYAKMAKALWD